MTMDLVSKIDLRLEQFRTQHEFARNFYDDYEFCPVRFIEECIEDRERIQRRTSPRNQVEPRARAIPIINPNNMTPVTVQRCGTLSPTITYSPLHLSDSTSTTSISSSSHSNSSSSSSSSHSSSSNSSSSSHSNHSDASNIPYSHSDLMRIRPTVYLNQHCNLTRSPIPRAIPIINPVTRKAFQLTPSQNTNVSPGYYDVSVC
ncbi:hypothetical protein BD560DRAFT_406801 [Blakeslea trispora]|nr:hypothetical protein BD560DRAFT_406801 [Blakeslea trispora]